MEIEQLKIQMRDMAAQQAHTIQLMEQHWKAKLGSQHERMMHQQQEKDVQMRTIIERLVSVENQLRNEQVEMERALMVKQKIIESHEKRITSLDNANKRLLATLTQFKERFKMGYDCALPGSIWKRNDDVTDADEKDAKTESDESKSKDQIQDQPRGQTPQGQTPQRQTSSDSSQDPEEREAIDFREAWAARDSDVTARGNVTLDNSNVATDDSVTDDWNTNNLNSDRKTEVVTDSPSSGHSSEQLQSEEAENPMENPSFNHERLLASRVPQGLPVPTVYEEI